MMAHVRALVPSSGRLHAPPRANGAGPRRPAWIAQCLVAILAAGCDAPTVPARVTVYPFTLQTSTGDVVMRWPAGSSIRVGVVPGGTGEANLVAAVGSGAAAWNAVALYGEYDLVPVSGTADADVLVASSDAPLPVDVSQCPPSGGGFGVTTFCLTSNGRNLQPFPLLQGGGGHVKMIVTVLSTVAADPARAERVVAHELGHVLGIARHSPNAGDLMAANPTVSEPAPADRATILALYHTPAAVTP